MRLKGVKSGQTVEIVAAYPASGAMHVVYRTEDKSLAEEILYAADEERLQIASDDARWDFSGDGAEFRYALEDDASASS